MGRILRYNLSEDIPTAIDFAFPTPGKLLIRNAGSNDVRVGYDPLDVASATGTSFFTIEPGVTYVFDMSTSSGFLAQDQQLFINSPDGANIVEVWFANRL
tara:strand:+ start:3322 stop:3621 length:300 start_codon:yes stop_codon:yes gene_type:complete